MKTKTSTNKLVNKLKKETIAHLNVYEMAQIKTAGFGQIHYAVSQDIIDDDDTNSCPMPVTTDSGLTPFCALELT